MTATLPSRRTKIGPREARAKVLVSAAHRAVHVLRELASADDGSTYITMQPHLNAIAELCGFAEITAFMLDLAKGEHDG